MYLNKNMMVRNYRILLFILLLLWFLVNLIQATFSEIISDEAYYSLYGRNLAWGYFDHPPMIALFTKISSMFFNGNLGIRLMTVIIQPLTLLITWRIIDDRHADVYKVFSFFIIACSICLFSVFGFYTGPDVPLLFFTAFFLYSYKNYLTSQTWKNVFLLSVSMAGLVYSKYHAVLLIGFVVISNIRLLKSYRFWIAGLCALALFTPHLWWQTINNYPSIKFHLIERAEGFRWINILEYIPDQLASFNPVVFVAVFYLIIKYKANDPFTRALYFIIIGFIGFFGLSAFHDHVEPQWTIVCSIPMIILLYNYGIENPAKFRIIRNALLPVVAILFIGRILLIADIPFGRKLGFNGKRMKFKLIESVAKDLPVVFPGSFQKPSLYSFFTGKEALCISTLYTRKTEFDIWQPEKKFNNKPAFIYGFAEGKSRIFGTEGIKFYGYFTDSLQTINRIGVEIKPRERILYPGDSLCLLVSFTNPYPYDINFNHRKFPVTVCVAFMNGRGINIFPVILTDPVGIIRSGEKLTRTLTTIIPALPAGRYNFGICLKNIIGPAINDSFSAIKIINR